MKLRRKNNQGKDRPMTTETPNVPDWCRPGAPAVITTGRDEHAEAGAREMWRAVTIVDVAAGEITVEETRPYHGKRAFHPAGPDQRPHGGPGWYLAPADAPDVIAQRRRRDLAKHRRPVSEWRLTPEGWQVGPRFRFEESEAD